MVSERLHYIWPQKLTFKSENVFYDTASSRLTRYKQILSACSFGCKNVLSFTCLSITFYNHGHHCTFIFSYGWGLEIYFGVCKFLNSKYLLRKIVNYLASVNFLSLPKTPIYLHMSYIIMVLNTKERVKFATRYNFHLSRFWTNKEWI